MTRNPQLNFRNPTRAAMASASGSDDEWAWWRDEIKNPEYRLKIWAWMALVSAFIGDEERTKEYTAIAEREKANIASRQNDQAHPTAADKKD